MAEGAEVTAVEIARLAGVGRAAVSNWRRRYQDFPAPVGGTDTSPRFNLADIERWLTEQGRLSATAGAGREAELVWQRLDALRGETDMTELVARACTFLAGIDGGTRMALLDPLRQALSDLAERDGAEATAERLIGRLALAKGRGLAPDPDELADLVVALAGVDGGTVFDPACGAAGLLRAAARAGVHTVLGQEVNGPLAELAASRLGFTGVDCRIVAGDSLRADAFADLAADTVLCNPPWGERNWGADELAYDPRWEYGQPARMESELAWVQHCLAHLRPGGTAVMVLPGGVNARGGAGRRIRAELLRRGALRAVFALPPGTLTTTSMGLFLWVLRRPDTLREPGPVLLVDASAHRGARAVDWAAVTGTVLGAWRDFAAGKDIEEPGVAAALPVIDLLDERVDLTPARHLRGQREEVDLAGLERERRELLAELAELRTLLPKVKAGGGEQPATTTIGDLARAGALVIRQQAGRLPLAEFATDGVPVLQARDVVAGAAPSGRLPAAEIGDEYIRLRAGDVVVPVVATRPTARVVREEQGALLGAHLQLLRPTDEALDPDFLAGYLRGENALRFSSTLSTAHRLDVRRVEVPVLPAQRQRRLGEAFRRLADFERRLRGAAERGGELAHSLAEGLATGSLRPGA
ncbi:MAG: N-6 DNA methylase [Sciscionella sp.]